MRRGAVPGRRVVAAALALCSLAACGKKGPPLSPLRPLPGTVTALSATRAGNEVRFRFTLPTRNVDNTTPISLDRLEVYAVTVAADAEVPANRDLFDAKYLVATIPVRPLPEEDAPAPAAGATPAATPPEDPRPAPGAPSTFVEELNEARLKPQVVAVPLTARAGAATDTTTTAIAAAWASAMATLKDPAVTRRVYVIRGRSRHGQPGAPSERVTVPLGEMPAAPSGLQASFTTSAITLTWSAPPVQNAVAALAAAPTFNIYAQGSAVPLNPKPLAATSFTREGVTFGKEECFVVRTAIASGNLAIESAPSPPVCATPADTFPPAAPTGLSAVATAGAVNLIWEANQEADLAGYIVLRGEAPGDKLQAITATPIRETTYRDATAVPGVRYVYAVVAVDTATPPNTSAQSARVEETAR